MYIYHSFHKKQIDKYQNRRIPKCAPSIETVARGKLWNIGKKGKII